MQQHRLQKLHQSRRLLLALTGAFIGAAAFLCIHTGASLNVTADAWILDGYVEKDILQHYTGWLFYRDAPLRFPLGISPAMQAPAGTAVTFTDSIPLFAIFFRLFAGVLPATFQYFGLFTLLCYALTGVAAALLLCLFLPDRLSGNTAVLLGTCLFVTYPILVERSFRHTALAAQFFILFALYLYFLDKKEGFRPRGGWFALTTLSAAIHPYFVPMIYALLLADLLEHAAAPLCAERAAMPHARRRAWLSAGGFLLANGAASLAALYAIGAFSSPASQGISGYSYFCMNLNALYNPASRAADGSFVWSRAIPALPQGLGTYDGFNYMGLGVLIFGGAGLLLFLYAAARAHFAPFTALMRRHWALGVVCAVLTVFAVSNVLVLNASVLFSLPIPGVVSRLGNTFRSSGRMFWPVNYLLLLCTVVFWARRGGCAQSGCAAPRNCPYKIAAKRAAGTVCTALLLAVQLWDISPALAEKHAAFAQPSAEFENPMQCAAWDAMTGHYARIFSLDDTLGQALYPALWAAQNGMTTNDGFTARFDFAAHERDVQAETQRLLAGKADADTLYLTCDYTRFAQIADALLDAKADVTCAWLDDIWYAIIPNRAGVRLPAASSDGYFVYPALPLKIATLTDALWTDGVLQSDRRTCIFYAGRTAENAFQGASQLVCDGAAYPILRIDNSDTGWVMVTLDLPDASVLTGKILTTR